MTVTDDQVATLRAMLAHDQEAHGVAWQAMESSGGQGDYGVLLAAALAEEATRRFKGVTVADIIRYVAGIRSRSVGLEDQLDPVVAERLLRSVLGDGDVEDLDDDTVVHGQTILVSVLVDEAGYDAVNLDEFIDSARDRANQWFAAL